MINKGLVILSLISANCFAQVGYRNPCGYPNSYQSMPDYNGQVLQDIQKSLQKTRDNARLFYMQNQIDQMYELENIRKYEEDMKKFLDGWSFPKGQVVEPPFFSSDDYIYVRHPGDGSIQAYDLEVLQEKIIKNGYILSTRNLFSFQVSIDDITEAMKRQKIGSYTPKANSKNKGKIVLRK